MSKEIYPDFQPTVEVLRELSPQDVEDFARLLPQLTDHSDTDLSVIEDKLSRAIYADDTEIAVIRNENGRIQATATANICRIPTGEKGWIDDVVTDRDYGGLGYAGLLIVRLHNWFTDMGVDASNLTSNPERLTAGRLYEKLGYEQRKTRVYRANLVTPQAVVDNEYGAGYSVDDSSNG